MRADGVPDDQHHVAGARGRGRQSVHGEIFPNRLATGREGRQHPEKPQEARCGVPRMPPKAMSRDRAADQPTEPGGQEQATTGVQGRPEQGPPDRQRGQQPRPPAQRDTPQTHPVNSGQHRPRDHQEDHVPGRDRPREISCAPKVPQFREVVFLQDHEHEIDITSGQPQPDHEDDRVRRRKKGSARRPLSPSFG